MSTVSRDVLNATLPEGPIWEIAPGEDLDLIFDAIGEILEDDAANLKLLAFLRNPQLTPILSDLEKEYGVIPNSGLTEQECRDRLSAYVYNRGGAGTIDDMIRAISLLTGLENVNVYANDPAVDPSGLETTLLVNGKDFDSNYTMPTDPGDWPLIFFVAGDVILGGSGEILELKYTQINRELEDDLTTVILRFKPTHSWAGLKVVLSNFDFYQYTNYAKMLTANIQKGLSTYANFNKGRFLRYDDILGG